MRMYESKDIQNFAGVSKIQLIHWTQTGAIEPYKVDRRRGGKRIYSQQNLIETIICRELNRLCVETKVMKALLNWLRKHRFEFVLLNQNTMRRLENEGTQGYPYIENIIPLYTEDYSPLYPEGTIKSTFWKFLKRYPKVLDYKRKNSLGISISRRPGDSSRSVSGTEFRLRPMCHDLLAPEFDEDNQLRLTGSIFGEIEHTPGALFIHLGLIIKEAGGI